MSGEIDENLYFRNMFSKVTPKQEIEIQYKKPELNHFKISAYDINS